MARFDEQGKDMGMRRRLVFCVAVALTLGTLTLSGCASEGPVKPAGLEQKIEAARTQADFDEIASVYEAQARVDRAAAESHRGLARAYRRGPSSPRGGQANMANHCDSLARMYQQAAEENLALAKEQRQAIAGDKR